MMRRQTVLHRPSRRRRPRLGPGWVKAQVDAILESGAVPELSDEDRAWDSLPVVGAERFWEPAQARLSFKKRLALKQWLHAGRRGARWRRARISRSKG